ncbi:hypothetical protein NEFER03_1476 [Nematocida sp. LUAm3]|nr:hypothetical protein NEFER03_1476 [Nematocida sp. LUAm3]KAI5174694.1 hypothetical protein NEFER02_0804 [Nematocida sp. LUAm2]KAI5177895.1 hypothetical protein NEFER01_1097 [Nematocida sp. LUAm1]
MNWMPTLRGDASSSSRYNMSKGGLEEACASMFFLLLFLYLIVYITHRYMLFTVDEISSLSGRKTNGFKASLLSFGLSLNAISLILHDQKVLGKYSTLAVGGSFVSNMLLCLGTAIILNRKRERIDVELVRQSLFFVIFTMILIILIGARSMNFSSIGYFVVFVYICHAFLLGDKDTYSKETEGPPRSFLKGDLLHVSSDFLFGFGGKNKKCSRLSSIISRAFFVLGWVLLFKDFNPNAYTVITLIGWSFLTFMLGKESLLFSSIHTFLCSSVWLCLLADITFSIIFSLIDLSIYNDQTVAYAYTTKYICLPFILIATGAYRGRYREVGGFAITHAVQNTLALYAMLLLANQSYLLIMTRHISYVIIFLFCSIIPVFINNEIRSGLFEIEVGLLMYVLYGLYLICLSTSPLDAQEEGIGADRGVSVKGY